MVLFEEEITTLFRVKKTLNQMLKDRGYNVTDSDIEMTREEFVDKHGGQKMKRKNLEFIMTKSNNASDKIVVFFPREEKVGVKQIKHCIDLMKVNSVFRAIVVFQGGFSSQAQSSINIADSTFYFEVFQETELLMNVTHHAFVPEHRVLTTKEKKTLLEKYTVIEKQLPRIHFTDPIARYYGIKRGEVVKIIRLSETSGRYVTYRYCI